MIRAYVAPVPLSLSRGIHRVADALARYAPPDIEIVPDQADADLIVCHMIGQEGWAEHLAELTRRGKRYAVFVYCFRTTTTPHAQDWLQLWDAAALVASYYNLPLLAAEDGVQHLRMNFLRVPLGVDTTVFRPDTTIRNEIEPYLVATSGYVAGTECVGEWAEVCVRLRKQRFHLGPDLGLPGYTRTKSGIDDAALASYLSGCRFVSGLRRSEGFELPAFEGLACGARPVMFAREDAIHWMGDAAEYLQEGSFDDVVAQLEALVQREPRPVTAEEIRWVGETFSWQRMAERFWSAISR